MAPRPGATARPKPRKKAKQKGDEVKHERALVSSVLDQMMEKQNRQLEQERDKQDAMVSAEEAQRKKREQRKVAKLEARRRRKAEIKAIAQERAASRAKQHKSKLASAARGKKGVHKRQGRVTFAADLLARG